jgi:hypothetical protein
MNGVAPEVIVMLGLDIDRPREEYRDEPDAQREAHRVIEYLGRVLPAWASGGATWTSFVCGSFIAMLESVGLDSAFGELLAEFEGVAGEIGCHTYSHRPLAPTPGRSDFHAMSDTNLRDELILNAQWISRYWPRTAAAGLGFRSPYGTDQLPNETVATLTDMRRYSSSLLRSQQHPLGPPVVEDGRLRQPFEYETGLWELPSHGYHDTFFANISGTSKLGRVGTAEAIAHYREVVRDAKSASQLFERPIFVGLTLHPFAMSLYDPDGALVSELHDELGATAGGFSGYGAVHERLSR